MMKINIYIYTYIFFDIHINFTLAFGSEICLYTYDSPVKKVKTSIYIYIKYMIIIQKHDSFISHDNNPLKR